MVRRTTASPTDTKGSDAAVEEAPVAAVSGNWLRKAFQRLSQWSWEQDLKRREAYLAQAQNVFDLETRMRHLDGDTLTRGQALR